MAFSYKTEEYYKRFIELQEKLRKSEEERLKLEMKFNEMVRITREEEQMHYRKLRAQYKRFLEEDRRRQDRNERIARCLERIESRVAMLQAKTERFKLLRQQYQIFLDRIYASAQIKKTPPPTAPPKEEERKFLPEDKNDVVQTYLQNLSSNKLKEMLKREDEARARLPSTITRESPERYSYTDLYTFPDEQPKPNYANSIADDIMNSIYKRSHQAREFNNNITAKPRSEIKTTVPFQSLLSTSDAQGTVNVPEDSETDDLSESDEILYKNPTEFNKVKWRQTVDEAPSVQQKASEDIHDFVPTSQAEQKYVPLRKQQDDTAFNSDKDLPVTSKNDDLMDRQIPLQPTEEKLEECEKTDREKVVSEYGDVQYENETDNYYAKEEINLPPPAVEEVISERTDEQRKPYDSRESLEQFEAEQNKQIVEEHMEENGKEAHQPIESTENEETDQPELANENASKELIQQHDNSEPVPYEQNELQICEENSQLAQQYDESSPSIQQYEDSGQSFQQYEESEHPAQQYSSESVPQYDESGHPVQQYEGSGQQIQQYEESVQPDQQSTGESLQKYVESEHLPQQYEESEQSVQHEEKAPPIQQYTDESLQQYNESAPADSVPHYDETSNPVQQYEENGQPLQEQHYENQNEFVPQYDETGQPINYDDSAQPLQQYDEQGQPIQPYDQQYDENGQFLQQYDEHGQLIPQYDEHGQLIQQYDENGQLIQQYDNQVYDGSQQYDENGQLIQYDENGQLVQQPYDPQFYGQPYEENVDAGIVEPTAEAGDDNSGEQQQQQQENPALEEPKKASNVMEMLDTDTESAKQESKISHDSDFDFSNG